MDSKGKFRCSLALLDPYTKQLIELEHLKIRDILNKKHNHPMNVKKLSKDARARIDILKIEEETLFQLDLQTPVRLWGFFEDNIFYCLWLDQMHEVYVSDN